MSDENPCSGSGCCQTSIPKGLNSLNYSLSTYYNYTRVSDFNLCGFAFLADNRSLKISDWQLSRTAIYGKDAYATDVVIEWVVEKKTCEQAKADPSAYACGTNAYCTYPEINQGYRCSCNEGFEGNPYLKDGCQDKDECKVEGKKPCQEGTCENTIGNYKCWCPIGNFATFLVLLAAIGVEETTTFELLPRADEGEMDEIEVVSELAKACLNSMGENRPTIKQVSDELAKLHEHTQKSWTQQNSNETDYLLGETSQSPSKEADQPMTPSQTVISFQIENYTDSI
ncbi:hypothetical protein DKX38_006554 [Salix brachista]|uniref:EGF-like domain-containing protein n=1 Tax=Salix brachista TaxID=2182728 RepID=A0A5N5N2K3_9ROSI|nr:hypothetical protein DKX38_006554 [Salix brachista]